MNRHEFRIKGPGGPILVQRDSHGVPHVRADSWDDAHYGLGWCHALDRGLQMQLTRILARGQASLRLESSPELLDVDRFFRHLGLDSGLDDESSPLTVGARAMVQAYCEGASACQARHGLPWELRLLRCPMEPWRIRDVFLMAKVIGYVTLAQSQADAERFLIESVQQGIRRDKLEELFPGLLEGLDEGLIQQLKLQERIVPATLPWASSLPVSGASNNWVLAGSRTASGQPMLCNDPHLEINRLPAVWYEAALTWKSRGETRHAMGASMPGVPGIIIGRTDDLAWGVTYACMDTVDSWIEECRAGQFKRGGQWHRFQTRRETIHRKGKPPHEFLVHTNHHGVLDGDPTKPGYCLATRWSANDGACAMSLDASAAILESRNVPEGQGALGRLCNSSWNWVLADTAGNIGYQMAGRMPLRRAGISGLVPLPGWDPANDWQGMAAPEDLPRALNPASGLLITANNDLNHLGRLRPINLCVAPYRFNRLHQLLRAQGRASVEDMRRIQNDLYSPQAEAFLAVLRPLLGEVEPGVRGHAATLLAWDKTYSADSIAPALFENVYRALGEEVFGGGGRHGCLGADVWRHVRDRTGVFFNYFGNFDRIMLSDRSAWYGAHPVGELRLAAINRGLAQPAPPWGQCNSARVNHLLLGGKLPLWLGFDRQLEMDGGRATIFQTQIYRSTWRDHAYGPSLSLIAELSVPHLEVMLPGGASDRRVSRWYTNLLSLWRKRQYRMLGGDC